MTKTIEAMTLCILLLLPLSGFAAGTGDLVRDLEKQPTEKSPFLASTPTNIIADALCAERLAAQRLKWTDDLRRRYDRFIEVSVHKGGDAMSQFCLEGEPKSPSYATYIPALGFIETNCYAIAPLLGHTNRNVRFKVINYYQGRAREVAIHLALQEDLHKSGNFLKGRGVPGAPWIDEVLYPLVARSMFDRDLAVQSRAETYCIWFDSEDGVKLADLARAQGTNEWAMRRWLSIYSHGLSNLVPQEMFEDVRKIYNIRKETEEREMLGIGRKDKKALKE